MFAFENAQDLNDLFSRVALKDREKYDLPEFLNRWLFAERLAARGLRKEMGFSAFEGPIHIRKFFSWLQGTDLSDYFESEDAQSLTQMSVENDTRVISKYKLRMPDGYMEKVGRYNAQDFLFQRSYPVPERSKVRTLMDFGAGHGRMANLSLDKRLANRVDCLIAVDGIPSSYFTQAAYYDGLGLKVWDYFEHFDEDLTPDIMASVLGEHDVVHIPTWRLDLVPDAAVDMVNCVQVLKELPAELVVFLMPQFTRVTTRSGAIYLRDHIQFHNPNHMPIDTLLRREGFEIEFAPQVKDRKEIHGIPRIWRKVDPALYL